CLLRPTTDCSVLPSISAADSNTVRRRRRCAGCLLCAPGDPADRRRSPLPARSVAFGTLGLVCRRRCNVDRLVTGQTCYRGCRSRRYRGSAGIGGGPQATVVAVVDARRRTRRVYRAVGSGSCVARRKRRQFDVSLRDFLQFDKRFGARPLLRRSDLRQEVSLLCAVGAFGSVIIALSSWWVAARPSTFQFDPPAVIEIFPLGGAVPRVCYYVGLAIVVVTWLALGRWLLLHGRPVRPPDLLRYALSVSA